VLAGLARNTAPGGTASTFTAAGDVRRGLQAAGFKVVKTPGYGPKRDMLSAVFHDNVPMGPYPGSQKPWYMGTPDTARGKTVAVVGAGLSGAFTAEALARRGWQVTVIERHARAAQEASGNEIGVIFSKLSAFTGRDYAFYAHSYLHAIRQLPDLLPRDEHWQPCGVLQLAFDDKERRRQQQVIDSGVWPPEVVCYQEAAEAGNRAGVSLPVGGLFFNGAGWLSPRRVCEYLLARHSSVQLLNNTEVLRLEPDSGAWRILTANGKMVTHSDVVVLATAADTVRFEPTAFLPLSRIRGQVTPVPATTRSSRLGPVLCYDGYITPAVAGWHGVGATFSHRDSEAAARVDDDHENLNLLQDRVPCLYEALQVPQPGMFKHPVGRAAFRCHTPDYLPVVGPVPEVEAFNRQYAPLSKGQLKRPYEAGSYLRGLYVNTAHGSRGVTTTPLCAEMIAAYICGEPQPVGETMRQALHPARFVIRALTRNK
jgi:tRNA 5-methylaminomethyl-2-thiouridine biosynthesis bifunctional protein